MSLIDREVDLTVFEARYRNDTTGAPAYDPAISLRLCCSRIVRASPRVVRSRSCAARTYFYGALGRHAAPLHDDRRFSSPLRGPIAQIFRDVLLVCDEAGLIGKQMFAIDGVKLRATPRRSGADAGGVSKKSEKMERAAQRLFGAAPRSPIRSRSKVRPPRWQAAPRAGQASRLWKPRSPRSGGFFGDTQTSRAVGTSKEEQHHRQRERQDALLQGPSSKAMTGWRWVECEASDRRATRRHSVKARSMDCYPDARRHPPAFRKLDLSNDVLKNRIVTADAGFLQ